MLMVISILCLVLLLTGCTAKYSRVKQLCQYNESLIFYRITDGKDTCLVCNFRETPYEILNIRLMDRETFKKEFFKKILNNDVIEVSEILFCKQQKHCSISIDSATNALYNHYGLDSLLNYLYQYPMNQLYKDNSDAFYWSAYLLWQNDIDVALDDEIYWWYIDCDGYRFSNYTLK